jgi:hypothetical protein
MDYQKLLKETNLDNLKVILKKDDEKGVGLFSTKEIKKDEIIAYYRVKIFREKTYNSPTGFVYAHTVYRKNGMSYKLLLGDIDSDCFPLPQDNISFWAPFANEPSANQSVNAKIKINSKNNFKDRNYLQVGETVTYKLVATKSIFIGEEILWFYGENYARNYKVGGH